MARTEQHGHAAGNAWSLDIQNPGFGGKLVLIGILILILQAALLLVHDMIEEREARHHQAVAEMARSWSLPQEISGPILAVPLVQGDDFWGQYIVFLAMISDDFWGQYIVFLAMISGDSI